MKKVKQFILGMMVLVSAGTVLGNEYDYWNKPYTIQALLGGVRYDDLTFSNSDGTETVTMDMSTLPQLGGAWATQPKGDKKLSVGLEASLLLGFKFDDVNTYSGARATYVSVSSSLWMMDIAGGAYANLILTEKIRLYAGAGPLVMLSYYSTKSDYFNTSMSDTAFGWGAYARGGAETGVISTSAT